MFRFTIRDVLWLTVVLALGVALWVDNCRHKLARAAAAAHDVEMQTKYGKLHNDYEQQKIWFAKTKANGRQLFDALQATQERLRALSADHVKETPAP